MSRTTIGDIRAAAAAIAGAVQRTPLRPSLTLSKLTGAELFLKFENLQFTASFKERGALNKLLGLTAAQKAAGVIAMSAGNHAQGVAYHALRLDIPTTIVMPRHTPNVKVRYTEELGATVVLHGDGLADAADFAHALADERGLTFVHPYEDDRIIAGTGTVALEMLEDCPDLDMLVVPVGGGGLISGMAIAARALKPEIAVIGVEAALYPGMRQALRGEEVHVGGATIAEGIAVKDVGCLTREIVRELVEDIILVDEDQIERALSLLLNIEKSVTEGAGAAALAAVLAEPSRFAGRRVGLVLSGGNIDPRLLASVILRDLVRDGRLARLHIRISDTPGELARIAAVIGECGGNIINVAHQRIFAHLPVKEAALGMAIETRDADQLRTIVEGLRDAGYDVQLLDEFEDESGGVAV